MPNLDTQSAVKHNISKLLLPCRLGMIVNVAESCQLGGCFVVCDERLANNQPFVPTSSIVVAGVRLCSEPRLGYNLYAGKCRDST